MNIAKLSLTVVVLIIAASFCSCSNETKKTEPGEIQIGIPVRVGTTDFSSSFSYYNTSPESPDGNKIAYTKFLSMPKVKRSEKVSAEIWVCNADLTDHKKVVELNPLGVHNGAMVQWVDNNSFAYQDDSIRVVDLDGNFLIKAVSGSIGHKTLNGRFLYSAENTKTQLSTIYEFNVKNQQINQLGDVLDFQKVVELYPSDELREIKDMGILHLQYSPEGKKIAFRFDFGSRDEQHKHLVTMNIDGSDIRYFGPKPMHFAWYDNESIMGHDNQIDDGMPNDRSGRRWDLERKYIETLSGIGNHLGASEDRMLFASESWYKQIPVILSVYKKGETEAFWQDTISTDKHTTWTLANHANPSFSRDGKRIYYNKCVAPGVVQTYMAVLPK
jgi:hypothetical protein